jgi:hypothetical protein
MNRKSPAPTIEADIACMDLTNDGMVRHASFKEPS